MILKNFKNLTESDYKLISKFIERDIFIYPTETIYGIGGNALSDIVIEKTYKIKKRKEHKKIIWLFKNIDMIKEYMDINPLEFKILQRVMPAPLTLILKRKNSKEKIGCRISPHPFVKNLFKFVNFPILSTSANISGEEYIHEKDVIIKKFKKDIDLFIFDENLKDSKPSTVIEIINGKLNVIRNGVFPINYLELNDDKHSS